MSCVYVGLFCLPSEGLVLLCDVSESVAADLAAHHSKCFEGFELTSIVRTTFLLRLEMFLLHPGF